jgi:hypothetical protein
MLSMFACLISSHVGFYDSPSPAFHRRQPGDDPGIGGRYVVRKQNFGRHALLQEFNPPAKEGVVRPFESFAP